MKTRMFLDPTPEGSSAFKAGISGGEEVISINGKKDFENVDFIYATIDDVIAIELQDSKGNQKNYHLKNSKNKELGLSITDFPIRRCKNKCIFCYIDQLPKGLRETLYLKDDDYQMSFFKGSYISFCNLKKKDIKKIRKYSMSPLYISLHSTDHKLRNYMMGNNKLPDPIEVIKSLSEQNISMHFQVVLCPGINDGANLLKTIDDVAKFYPQAASISIVPAASTKFRKNKDIIKPIDKVYSKDLIDKIRRLQKNFEVRFEEYFIYLADEFYISAGEEFPEDHDYYGYPQIENGVGLSRKFITEFNEILQNKVPFKRHPKIKSGTIITGKLATELFNQVSKIFNEKFSINLSVVGIHNDFLGHSINVTGLLTAVDIIEQLSRMCIKEPILIPDIIFSDAFDKTLDNYTKDEVRSRLNKEIIYVPGSNASSLIDILICGVTK